MRNRPPSPPVGPHVHAPGGGCTRGRGGVPGELPSLSQTPHYTYQWLTRMCQRPQLITRVTLTRRKRDEQLSPNSIKKHGMFVSVRAGGQSAQLAETLHTLSKYQRSAHKLGSQIIQQKHFIKIKSVVLQSWLSELRCECTWRDTVRKTPESHLNCVILWLLTLIRDLWICRITEWTLVMCSLIKH